MEGINFCTAPALHFASWNCMINYDVEDLCQNHQRQDQDCRVIDALIPKNTHEDSQIPTRATMKRTRVMDETHAASIAQLNALH